MHIKKFTQFIVENEHYGSINEGDIVPGVTFNSGIEGTGKETNVMWVYAHKGKNNETIINFRTDSTDSTVELHFPDSKSPVGIKQGTAYAYVAENRPGEKEPFFHTAVMKMDDFAADKSGVSLNNSANSIDLLADFMARSGIGADANSGRNLAKVITNLLLSPTYNTQVSDTFKKFATNIGSQITIKAFLPRMAKQFGDRGFKQSPGMQSFIEEWPLSYAALSPKK
jgi:hypothetical protein